MTPVLIYRHKPWPTVLSSLGRYQATHSDLSTEEALDSFTLVIGGGIDKGFKEARAILNSLNVLKEGNIASNIDAIYELVQNLM